MSSRPTKQTRIDDLVDEFRASGNEDRAFDNLAAQRLGVNLTDLHCLNVLTLEQRRSISASELAAEAGLTSGAITGVIDRLERIGYARRERDPDDRRRVAVAVTAEFHAAAAEIWSPVKQDWDATLAGRFTSAQLDVIIAFLRATNDITRRHIERVDGELRG